jgi:Asp-tRNA(Asn)/Glu-tRNA(Gln) amidotransferase C subunit
MSSPGERRRSIAGDLQSFSTLTRLEYSPERLAELADDLAAFLDKVYSLRAIDGADDEMALTFSVRPESGHGA